MKVLKFGGSSVGSIASLMNVKKIVESCNEPVIVVVSAVGGVTDSLIQMATTASKGDDSYLVRLDEMKVRHEKILEGLFCNEELKAVRSEVRSLLEDLTNIFKGICLIKDLSEKTLATVLSYGERISSKIVTALIKDAVHYDSLSIIKTEQQFVKHVVDFKITNELISQQLSDIKNVAVMGGFISTDAKTNDITNLGRGGSDYTAAIVAGALNAEILEIWTDVDGFMTADPRVINW